MTRITKSRLLILIIALCSGGAAIFFSNTVTEPKVITVVTPQPKLDTIELLVAARDLEVGDRIQIGDLRWQSWPSTNLSPHFISRANNPNALDQFQAAFVKSKVSSGEPIGVSKIVRADGAGYMSLLVGKGMRAIAIEISPETSVGGFVLPNDRVDVLLTRINKSANGSEYYTSETILTDIKVLAIDQRLSEANGQRAVIGKIAILELSPRHSESLALARRLGSVSLVLRNYAEQLIGDVNLNKASEPIKVIRFGVTSTVEPR